MSYQVLARKWRPRTFQEMVGQAPILRMLANALEQKRLHHAYLFTGTRGVGKTTIARILAKSLNCQTGITNTPCSECDICKAIDEGRFLDLYEVDAASRTKVEDTRDLLENVCYPPNQGRYKIYLIDEVHMLSNHSFNALLKTLEEPPEHVKFLLATTDPKRLPITILSRCLQFHLKRLPPEQIAKHLRFICDAEKISHEEVAINKIAFAADGSMRDALSLLDQAIAYGCGKITNNDVFAMLGSLSQDDVYPLLQALAEQNGPQLFAVMNQLADRGPDYEQLLEELITLLHKLAIFQTVPGAIDLDEQLQLLARQFKPEDIQLHYQIALLGRRDLAYAAAQKQGFEMIMLRMLAFQPQTNQVIVPTPREKQEKQPISQADTQAEEKTNANKDVPEKDAPPLDNVIELQNHWREILPKLDLTGLAKSLASNCTLVKKQVGKYQLALAITHQPMLNNKLKERIAEALTRHLNQTIQVDISVTHEEIVTPIRQHQQEKQQMLVEAKAAILQDPNVKKLIEVYDATVEVSLLN